MAADPGKLSQVLTDVHLARGLPNAHYMDSDVFNIERDALLFEQWAGIGFTSDVPEPGDAKPVTFLGVPLLLVRDHDGDIRVFHLTIAGATLWMARFKPHRM